MLRSLYSAVSGISVNQNAMDVIGNNISNVNTIGYKMGRAVFQDLLSQTMTSGKAPSDSTGGINPRQVGTGAFLVAVDNIMEQGVIKSTASTTDLAIEGNGYFILRGEGATKYYTRAGDFNFDKTGVFTNPSGYRVQGWMADPTTGNIKYNSAASDIALSDAHKIMQAKATSDIKYAGVLDSSSTGSKYTFNKMLTQANGQMSIFDVLGTNGGTSDTLGLKTNGTVTVKAHATGLTRINQIYTEGGQAVNLKTNSTVTFTVNGVAKQIKYVTSGDNAASGEFSTMQGLVDCMNTYVFDNGGGTALDATFKLENGQIKITGNATANFEINSITSSSQNLYLTNLLSPLQGNYIAASTNETGTFYFQSALKASENFKTLNDLAAQIQSSIKGNVLDNFSSTFLENNFGLNNGDTFAVNYINGATPGSATFTYTSNPDMVTGTTFHTLSDLANAMSNTIPDLTASVNGEGLDFKYNGTSSMEFTNFTTTSVLTGLPNASPYMEGVFNSLIVPTGGPILTTLSTTANISEVAGKGRLTYNNSSTLYNLTGFSIKNSSTNEFFDKNIFIKPNETTLNAGNSTYSKKFLTTATEDTLLIDLFDQSGNACSFVDGSTVINFNATIDKNELSTANAYSVGVKNTVSDMMTALEEYLGLGSKFNSRSNVVITNGVMTVFGEDGEANDITSLQLTAKPASANSVFNSFIGTPQKTATAAGGRYVSDMTIYDQQGNAHVVEFDFAAYNKDRNEWKLKVSTSGTNSSVSIDGATTNEIIIAFSPDGKPSHVYDPYTDPVNLIASPSISFNPGNGTNAINNIKVGFGTPGTNDGLTLSDAPLSINTAEQNGYQLGALEKKFCNEDGIIIGYYTNGQVRNIAQVATSTFANDRGLMKVGGTMFAETVNSGTAAIGTPNSGFRGKIAANSLEQSNVDLSTEFVNMIVTQRGFQANSRVVTTSDEMIQELLNLKR